VFGGLLLLFGRFVPLALTLAAELDNILAFRGFYQRAAVLYHHAPGTPF
jgi:hypothetical protein